MTAAVACQYVLVSEEDLVDAAVSFYLDTRREDVHAGMRELPSKLDAYLVLITQDVSSEGSL